MLGLVVTHRDRALPLSVTSLVWTFVLAILAVPSLPPRLEADAAPRQARLAPARDVTIAPAHVAPRLPHPALLAALTRFTPPSFDRASSSLPVDHPRVPRTPRHLHKLVLLL